MSCIKEVSYTSLSEFTKASKTSFLFDLNFLLSIESIDKPSSRLYLYTLLYCGEIMASRGLKTIFKTSPL